MGWRMVVLASSTSGSVYISTISYYLAVHQDSKYTKGKRKKVEITHNKLA